MQIEIFFGDITELQVDAIVNAANSGLFGGGGVDGAIHRKGGKIISEECSLIRSKQGGCQVGEAVYTSAGNLLAKYIIHTVGPFWSGGYKNEDEHLKNCYVNSLKLAENLNVETIAFPNISTGVYRFPKERAAKIAVDAVINYSPNLSSVNRIYFVCFDENNYRIYKKLIED